MSIFYLVHAAGLARKQLFHNRVRLLVAVAGIAFAVLLIFMQTGFRKAIFQSSITAHEHLDADLVLYDQRYTNIANTGSFSRKRLFQCLSDPEVEDVTPLYIGRGKWKNIITGISSTLTLYGMPPEKPAFALPELPGLMNALHRADALIFDTSSRPRYGPVVDLFRKKGEVPAIINERNLVVTGLYTMGKPFDTDGSAILSIEGFLRILPDRAQGVINAGLIKLKKGAARLAVRDRLRALFADELKVDTRDDFAGVEYAYTDKNNPIGFVFNLGTVMGLIVGIVIVYQVLFADVAEHFAEYATLKAVGYSNAFLFTVVAMESIFLSLTGFVPGFLVSWALYAMTVRATSLPMFMTLPHILTMLAFTVGMCTFSGAIALYKVAQADPAEVF